MILGSSGSSSPVSRRFNAPHWDAPTRWTDRAADYLSSPPPSSRSSSSRSVSATPTGILLYSSRIQQPQQPVPSRSVPAQPKRDLSDRPRPISVELRIRRSLTSTADINEAGQGRTPASLSGCCTSRRPQSERARIALLKRESQVRVRVLTIAR